MNARLTPPVGPRDHGRGPTDAPVTLVEYGDYECPHCGHAFPVVEAVRRRLGASLRFVFRNFPLREIHPHAVAAAEMAEAAGEQGEDAFWAMHEQLFRHQHALGEAHLARYAERLGLDPRRLAEARRAGAALARVEADFQGGIRSGVNGTPTFFVDGERFDGYLDEDALVAALERRLVASRSR